jgi:hypothetical protein
VAAGPDQASPREDDGRTASKPALRESIVLHPLAVETCLQPIKRAIQIAGKTCLQLPFESRMPL